MIRFSNTTEIDRTRTASGLATSLRAPARRLQLYLGVYEERFGDDLDVEKRFMLEEARRSADDLMTFFNPDRSRSDS